MPVIVDPTGSGVLCPLSSHLDFLVKSSFTSQTRCSVTFCQPLGACSLSCRTSKAPPMLYISLAGHPSTLYCCFTCLVHRHVPPQSEFGPIIMGDFPDSPVDGRDDCVPLLKGVWYPPAKCWLVTDTSCHHKLSHLYRVQFFHHREFGP